MTATILTSTEAFVLESMPSYQFVSDDCNLARLSVDDCKPRPDPFFYTLEVVCIVIFTADYLLRICTVHSVEPYEFGFDESSRGTSMVCDIAEISNTLRLKQTV